MTIEVQDGFRYNLQTFAGDSGTLTLSGFPTDKTTYVVYMEVRGKVTIEKSIALNGLDSCEFSFTPSDTLSLGVGNWEYGIKLCDSETGVENTLIPDLVTSSKAIFTVYSEKVEGIANA